MCPKTPVVPFDDRAADGEPDSHAIALRRVERLEQSFGSFGPEADAGIAHGEANLPVFVTVGPNQQKPRTVVDGAHRIRGIAQEVHDHLLELDTIAGDQRQFVGQFGAQHHSTALQIADDSAMTSRAASLRSSGSTVTARLVNSARNRAITSAARLPSRIVRRAVSCAPSTFGGSAASMRRHVLALVMMPASGWLTSWAIEAVNAPRLMMRVTLRKLRSQLLERLFREPALRDVENRAIYSISPPLFRALCAMKCRYLTDWSGIRIRGWYSKSPPPRCARPMPPATSAVFGMDPGGDPIERHDRARLELVDAVELLRPDDLAARDIPGQVAHASEMLAFRQERLAAPHSSSARLRSSTSLIRQYQRTMRPSAPRAG